MGKILGVYLMPHPPIIVPEVGRGEEVKAQNTIEALRVCSKEIRDKSPGNILVITPHGPTFSDGIAIMAEKSLKGDFGKFGVPKLAMTFENSTQLVEKIIEEAGRKDILCVGLDKSMANEYNVSIEVDWGVLVPMYFVSQEYKDFRLVQLSVSMLPYEELYLFGRVLQAVIDNSKEDSVIIASGDLSHRLSEAGPYGFNPMGPKLDEAIIEKLKTGDVEGLFNMDPVMIEEGGECGLRSIIMAMGVLDGYEFYPRVLSYEGPFGVGYGVATFEPGPRDKRRQMVDRLFEARQKKIESIRRREDPYVSLARKALESYILNNKVIKSQNNLPEEMLRQRAGVFVSIKKHGQLRGCIGTIEPTKESIAEEIIHNAISAGTRDPRFFPVEKDELNDLVFSVDVLAQPEPIDSIDQLDVKRYGVIIRKGMRTGLLLPNLEGINTPEEQVRIALRKAGISPEEEYTMERFEVIRHK